MNSFQIDIGDDCTPESVGNYGPIPSEGAGVSMADSDHDETVYPNLIRVLEYIQSSSLE